MMIVKYVNLIAKVIHQFPVMADQQHGTAALFYDPSDQCQDIGPGWKRPAWM